MDTDSEYQYTDPKNNQGKKKILLIALVVVLGAIAAVAIALSFSLDTGQSPENAGNESAGTVQACEDEECFSERFSSCQPTRYEVSEGQEVVEYEILGTEDINCPISLRYTSSEDEELVGKGMTCDFDNSLDLRSAARLAFTFPANYECQGELADYLQA